ncbi:MAG: 30S ribosomal protein S2 [Candidatus Latescibacterota bacterium]
MSDFTIRDLLEAGTHFGHQTRRWNPAMRPYIFTERNGIHIIDLQKTVGKIRQACDAVRQAARSGRAILFVATKKQAGEIVRAEAERCGQYYVTERWLGGMLTNWDTIRHSIRHLDYLDRISQDGTYEKLKKKEVLVLEKEREKLKRTLTGIRQMGGLPGLVYIVDIRKEHIAVREAAKLEVPAVAIVDTNCDPESVTYPIPGNDDAIRSISLITRLIADAALEGRVAAERERQAAAREEPKKEGEGPHTEGREAATAAAAAR